MGSGSLQPQSRVEKAGGSGEVGDLLPMSKEYHLIFRRALNPKVEIADLRIITKQPSAELHKATFKKNVSAKYNV